MHALLETGKFQGALGVLIFLKRKQIIESICIDDDALPAVQIANLSLKPCHECHDGKSAIPSVLPKANFLVFPLAKKDTI